MSFVKDLEENLNVKQTENLDKTYHSSLNKCVDLFALGGVMRKSSENDIKTLFYQAYNEDPLVALRTLFYLRDVRGGQGERRFFRIITRELANNQDKNLIVNLHLFGEFGRWDDLIILLDSPIGDNVLYFIAGTLSEDIDSDKPTLLAKWLPSENTSSAKTKKLARLLIKKLGVTAKKYRQTLSTLRQKIDVVERKMSDNEWKAIKYSGVPSRAMMIYRKAFTKHDEQGFTKFLESVKKGEAKIQSSTLYPYEIYDKVRREYSDVLEEQWKALPDFTRGNNAIVVADVSGSMMGRPMSVSVSLALYFAERNVGQFKDYFMTFSSQPQLVKVQGNTLRDKMFGIERANWQMNTDLRAVFRTILDTATKNSTPAEEMPSTIYIISDMQFDRCVSGKSSYEDIKEMYANAGYTLPTVVFWNVDDRRNHTTPVTIKDSNTCLVSGFSPSVFRLAVENKSPMDVMLETVSSERYAKVVLAE